MTPQFAAWPSAGARGDNAVRLVLVNVNHHNRDYERMRAFLREVDPDILLLEEVDAAWMDALSDVTAELPYGLDEYRSDPFGIALRSRFPVRAEILNLAKRNPTILGDVDVPNGPLSFVGTHPYAPTSWTRSSLRDAQLSAIAEWTVNREGPAVILGDLNTTVWGQPIPRARPRHGPSGHESWPPVYVDVAVVLLALRHLNRSLPRIGRYRAP